MSNQVGRNDPCPCGSGRKYKKCCQVRLDETDFQYRRWRQIEARLIPELLSYALETRGPEVIEDAWSEFHDDAPDETYDPETPMNMLFMPWFLFNWIHKTKPPGAKRFKETTIAASFLNENEPSVDEQKLLASAIRAPYSLHEVVAVTAGVGMTLFDLLCRVRCEVLEQSGSHMIRKGEILYCAMTHIEGITSNIGTGPYALRPTAKRDILELRKLIGEQTNRSEITVNDLSVFAADIRAFYLDTVKAMFRPPLLTNTDKDPFVPQKIHFEIESAQAAFEALKDLAEGVSEDHLLANATRTSEEVTRVEIPWFGGAGESSKRLGGPVLLGVIQINNRKMVVDVNSTRRAHRIQQLIGERLGKKAIYKTTLIEPIEAEVEKMWAAAASDLSGRRGAERPKRRAESDTGKLVDLSPELRLRLEEDAKQYWVAWLDVPVPALNNMTPREAAKTEEGRDLLESLLLFYESHDNDSSENVIGPDVNALRRALGMPA